MIMSEHKIRENTKYAFICIALMILAFLIFVMVMSLPIGLSESIQQMVVQISLYGILLFAVLGGVFSIRVAKLRKDKGK